jgi:hypothetical protein
MLKAGFAPAAPGPRPPIVPRRRRSARRCAAYRYFFLPDLLPVFCERALPAADLDAALVRPPRSVFDAAVAALLEVVSFGELRCVSALPAADFDVLLVDPLDRVLEAFEAAALLVCLPAIYASRKSHRRSTEISMPWSGGLTIGCRRCGAVHDSAG